MLKTFLRPHQVGFLAPSLFIKLAQLLVGGLALLSGSVFAAAVDLNGWTATVGGNWTSNELGSVVTQSVNGNPTIFYGDFDAYGTKVTGTVRVDAGAGDDDFIGFVIGFQPDDDQNSSADYLLLDWKRLTTANSAAYGGPAPKGMFLSRVNGVPSAAEFWTHTNVGSDGGITPLAFGPGNSRNGWVFGRDYEFEIDFGPNNLIVKLDGFEEFNVMGSFDNGRLGFYNFSQGGARYSNFEVDVGSFSVPIPAAAWLFGSALLGLGAIKLKKA